MVSTNALSIDTCTSDFEGYNFLEMGEGLSVGDSSSFMEMSPSRDFAEPPVLPNHPIASVDTMATYFDSPTNSDVWVDTVLDDCSGYGGFGGLSIPTDLSLDPSWYLLNDPTLDEETMEALAVSSFFNAPLAPPDPAMPIDCGSVLVS